MCRFGPYLLKSKEFCAEVTLQDNLWAEPTGFNKQQLFCKDFTYSDCRCKNSRLHQKTEPSGIKKMYNDFLFTQHEQESFVI